MKTRIAITLIVLIILIFNGCAGPKQQWFAIPSNLTQEDFFKDDNYCLMVAMANPPRPLSTSTSHSGTIGGGGWRQRYL